MIPFPPRPLNISLVGMVSAYGDLHVILLSPLMLIHLSLLSRCPHGQEDSCSSIQWAQDHLWWDRQAPIWPG